MIKLTVPGVWLLLAGLHAGVAAVWWRWGGGAGFALLALLHAGLLASTLWPGSTWFCPARRRFGGTEKSLILTIDDGPCADTLTFLDLLDAHGARAVFFLIGERAAAHPELVQAIRARGHDIQNHTLTHPEKWFWSFGPARQRREILGASKVLSRITGQRPRWFRAPAGFRNPFAGAILRELGMDYLGWTARGFDTSDTDIPRILARLRRGFQPGAVLLVHQGHPHSAALLRALLEELAAGGWTTCLPAHPPSGARAARGDGK